MFKLMLGDTEIKVKFIRSNIKDTSRNRRKNPACMFVCKPITGCMVRVINNGSNTIYYGEARCNPKDMPRFNKLHGKSLALGRAVKDLDSITKQAVFQEFYKAINVA